MNFKSGYTGILPITGLFETFVVLEEVQLAYSRRSKKLPIDSFSKSLSNRMNGAAGCLVLWLHVFRLVGSVCTLRVLSTTVMQLRPSRVPQWASTNCKMVPWCAISRTTRAQSIPPVGISLCWGWTTSAADSLLQQYMNKPWSCLQSSTELMFMKIIVVNNWIG